MTGPTITCPVCRQLVRLGEDRWIQLRLDGRYRTVHADCAANQPEQQTIEQAAR